MSNPLEHNKSSGKASMDRRSFLTKFGAFSAGLIVGQSANDAKAEGAPDSISNLLTELNKKTSEIQPIISKGSPEQIAQALRTIPPIPPRESLSENAQELLYGQYVPPDLATRDTSRWPVVPLRLPVAGIEPQEFRYTNIIRISSNTALAPISPLLHSLAGSHELRKSLMDTGIDLRAMPHTPSRHYENTPILKKEDIYNGESNGILVSIAGYRLEAGRDWFPYSLAGVAFNLAETPALRDLIQKILLEREPDEQTARLIPQLLAQTHFVSLPQEGGGLSLNKAAHVGSPVFCPEQGVPREGGKFSWFGSLVGPLEAQVGNSPQDVVRGYLVYGPKALKEAILETP